MRTRLQKKFDWLERKITPIYNRFDQRVNGTLTMGRLQPRQWFTPFMLLIFVLVVGPTSPPGGLPYNLYVLDALGNSAIFLALIVGLGLCLDQFLRLVLGLRWLFWVQFGFIAVGMGFFVYALFDGHLKPVDADWRQGDRVRFFLQAPWFQSFVPFAHVWLPLAFWMFVMALFARWGAHTTLWSLPGKIRTHKNYAHRARYIAEMSDHVKPPPQTTFFRSFFDVLASPVEILFPPAVFIVLIDQRLISQIVHNSMAGKWIYYLLAVSTGVVALGMLIWAEHSNTMSAMRANVRFILWYGGSFLTTALVIVLAVLWLYGVSYVTTVMEGSRLTVVALVLSCYALSWAYSYWLNRTYCEELLALLGDVHDHLYVRFDATPPRHAPFCVCIHGSAKLAIVEQADPAVPATPLRVFERTEFFEELFAKMDAGEVPANQITTQWGQELSGKAKFYFVGMDALILAPIVLIAWCMSTEQYPTRLPIASANVSSDAKAGQLRDMETLLFDEPDPNLQPGKRPNVILVAASGGGTRAALYASSALDGLRAQKKIANVKAVSGVSGGGVALAYFAAHRQSLVDGDDATWDKYHEAMAYPYFMDVFAGMPEFRVPWHSSISVLLPESFERQFFKGEANDDFDTFEKCPIGVIFNTTLAGESPPPFTLPNFKDTDDIQRSEYASGLHAGSRLVFTNLNHPEAFPIIDKSKYWWNEVLRYGVVNDPNFKLTRAASMNANFPPVFPNAPVDVTQKDETAKDGKRKYRYWVTDGGAEENRGQVSMLYAVKGAIKRRLANKKATVFPNIHLVILEASGGSTEYAQDFGIGAALGAPQKLANQLALELESEIQRLYGKCWDPNDPNTPSFKTYYLPMPSAFRIDGGVGTHWMMPPVARLGQPTVRAVRADPDIYVHADDLKKQIRKLHQDAMNTDTDDLTVKLNAWRKTDPLPPTHAVAWQAVCDALR